MDLSSFQLTDFQGPAHNKLVTQKRHLLLMRMGLGKTVVGTKAAYDVKAKRILILCPKNAIRTWEDHIKVWFDALDIQSGNDTSFNIWRWRKRYNNSQARKKLWRSIDKGADVNIWITTFAGFVADRADFVQHYDCIIIDEAKRVRSHKSLAFKALQPLAKRATWVWPMTGTPGFLPQHFWTMFNLIDPVNFGSYWRFVQAFLHVIKNGWGQMEIVGWKNRDSWYDLLRRKATIITKEDVGHRETVRDVIFAEMDDCQAKLYKEMEDEMMIVGEESIHIASTSMTQALRLRQILICPKLLDPSYTVGQAFVDFTDMLKEEDTDSHVVIFTPFTSTFGPFESYLKEHGFINTFRLQGGLDPDEQQRRIQEWRRTKGIMFCSIMYAQSFSLEPAKDCHFFGYEWNFEDNAQAEERLNRLTTPYQVNAHYWLYEGTYDMDQLEKVNFKQRQANATLPKRT